MNIYICSDILSPLINQQLLTYSSPSISSLFIYQHLDTVDQITKLRLTTLSKTSITFVQSLELESKTNNVLVYSNIVPYYTVNIFDKIFKLCDKEEIQNNNSYFNTNNLSDLNQEIRCSSLEQIFELSTLSVSEIKLRKQFESMINNNLKLEKQRINDQKITEFVEKYRKQIAKRNEGEMVRMLRLLRRILMFRKDKNKSVMKEYFNRWIVGHLEEQIKRNEKEIQSSEKEISGYQKRGIK